MERKPRKATRAKQKRSRDMAQGLTIPQEHLAAQASQEPTEVISSLDIYSISMKIFEAFSEIADNNEGLIKQFLQAFQERARDPFLSESREGNGLALTLEEVLGRYPDEAYLNFSQTESHLDIPVEQIKILFRSALEAIITHNPGILQSLQEIQDEINWAIYDMLKALFAEYIDNKSAYPY